MYIDQLLARMQEHHYLYILEHKLKVGWYLIDIYGKDGLGEETAAIWFPNKRIALAFEEEEEVEEFKHDFLATRPVSIVKIQRGALLQS